MYRSLFFLIFLSSFSLFAEQVALYEGRICPLETIPEGASYQRIEVDDYRELAGTPFLRGGGKQLLYPTYGQLFAEKLLYHVPFKWMIISLYLASIPLLIWKRGLGIWICLAGFAVHTATLALRCYILSRPPVSNMSETLLYVPWIAMLVGWAFTPIDKKWVLPSAAMAASLLLLLLPSHLRLSSIPPVLNSQYWLMIHVLMVVGSYGVFALSSVLGHLLLVKKNLESVIVKPLLQSLYIGTALLICGTLLGGVWAAQSWGRFWDWDPKESWAFISSGLYVLCIHAYRFKLIGPLGLAFGSVFCFLAITFTWYGVNYILGTGLHSYGFGHGGELFYYSYLALELIFLITIGFKKALYKN